MSAARLIDMEANHLLAHGTLCRKRVKPLPSQELYELSKPHGKRAHIRLLANFNDVKFGYALDIEKRRKCVRHASAWRDWCSNEPIHRVWRPRPCRQTHREYRW